MSYVLRPVCEGDLEDVHRLAMEASSGLTSLPKNLHVLERKIQKSIHNFQKNVTAPEQEFYLFVLEHLISRKCIGISGVYSRTGVHEPLFWYKIEGLSTNRSLPEMHDFFEILRPVLEYNGPTEIGTLFLDSSHRKEGLGKLLSFGRFMFMADYIDRFEKSVFANMRGVILPNDVSPFWDAIGRRIFDINFLTLMKMLHHNRGFVTALVPPFPIYIDLLPHDVQLLIGKTHPATTPALNILIREGFSFTQKIDPFDGGPIISCPTNEIRTIRESQKDRVNQILEEVEGDKYLISNQKINFRCCIGPLIKDEKGIILPKEIADSLEIQEGDSLRFIPLKS